MVLPPKFKGPNLVQNSLHYTRGCTVDLFQRQCEDRTRKACCVEFEKNKKKATQVQSFLVLFCYCASFFFFFFVIVPVFFFFQLSELTLPTAGVVVETMRRFPVSLQQNQFSGKKSKSITR